MKLLALRSLSHVAAGLNRLGLGGVNQIGARLLTRTLVRQPLTVVWDGLRFQGSFDSWPLLREIERGEFEPYTLALFREALRPGMTVVDVGANVGLYTVVAARAVGPAGRVFAFEPDPRSHKDLETNVRLNGFKNVRVIRKAVSSSLGEGAFHLRRPAGHSSLYADVEKYLSETSVETATLDEALAAAKVDVLKIDVEGAEVAVLHGAEETLRRSAGLVVFIEYAPFALESAGSSGEELLSLLHSHFDQVRLIDERSRELGDLSDVRRGNLVCFKSSPPPNRRSASSQPYQHPF